MLVFDLVMCAPVGQCSLPYEFLCVCVFRISNVLRCNARVKIQRCSASWLFSFLQSAASFLPFSLVFTLVGLTWVGQMSVSEELRKLSNKVVTCK